MDLLSGVNEDFESCYNAGMASAVVFQQAVSAIKPCGWTPHLVKIDTFRPQQPLVQIMDPVEVEKLIKAGLPGCEVIVKGDGSHFDAIVVGDVFAGKSLVKQQQLVYATVVDRISNGQLHALSIKTYTPPEWERAKKLQLST